jgi:c(7)-type cytochrome triheme protein
MKCRFLFFLFATLLFLQSAAFAVTIRNITFATKNAGKVVFNHGVHINKQGMTNNCRACHDVIFDLKKKKRYVMADMETGKSCGACHNGNKAFGLDKCGHCHQSKEKIYNVKATGPTRFSH